jgi:hypothetical protein
METRIQIQVQCIKPSWVNYQDNRYRLYVNNDLLVERTWSWPITQFVEEDILADLEPDTNNTLRLEAIPNPPDSNVQFGLRILKINGWPRPDWGGENTELNFHL